jgi:L-histidine N-alpha-methyltransferase
MDGAATAPVTIDVRLPPGGPLSGMAADVRAGLTKPFKELKPRYFYDERGSELFDRITELPEYYPTRCERAILNRHAPEIARRSQAQELVELGSGSASKTRALLYAMAGTGGLRRYVPLDCSAAVLERSAAELVDAYPGLAVHGVVGDFERHLEHIPRGEGRLVAFLGGTIGNLYPEQRLAFLDGLREQLGSGDWLLLGTDLVKDVETLEAAYNDAEGVTAEFNRNVLRVINKDLDGDFDPDSFDHVAFYDDENARVEMRLRAVGPQRARVEKADLDVRLADGEEIRTEISSKFTAQGIVDELAESGFALEAFYTDAEDRFGVSLLRPG